MIKPVRNNYLHVEAIIKFFGVAIPANSDKLPVSEWNAVCVPVI